MSEALYKVIAIALGGGIGAVTRFGVGMACESLWGSRFAHGTLVVNTVGCFALGLLMHEAWLAIDKPVGPWHAGVTVGLLGGLTTFSTFGYQSIRHLEAGEPALALVNVALNVVLGLAAAAFGLALARALWPLA